MCLKSYMNGRAGIANSSSRLLQGIGYSKSVVSSPRALVIREHHCLKSPLFGLQIKYHQCQTMSISQMCSF